MEHFINTLLAALPLILAWGFVGPFLALALLPLVGTRALPAIIVGGGPAVWLAVLIVGAVLPRHDRKTVVTRAVLRV